MSTHSCRSLKTCFKTCAVDTDTNTLRKCTLSLLHSKSCSNRDVSMAVLRRAIVPRSHSVNKASPRGIQESSGTMEAQFFRLILVCCLVEKHVSIPNWPFFSFFPPAPDLDKAKSFDSSLFSTKALSSQIGIFLCNQIQFDERPTCVN